MSITKGNIHSTDLLQGFLKYDEDLEVNHLYIIHIIFTYQYFHSRLLELAMLVRHS